MIGRIRGLLVEKHPPNLLIDVNGIAYELEAPMTTFYALPALNDEVVLHTHLMVREDAHRLFGFITEDERRLFRTLLKVNGVGAKLALAILSGCGSDEFVSCVRDGDSTRLTRLPGVGKKTAERLIIEMRDRLADWGAGTVVSTAADGGPVSVAQQGPNPVQDAIAGLIALGYKPQDASRNVHAVADETMTTEEIIRLALKAMV